MNEIFILTFEYHDRSGFFVCGATHSNIVANAWTAAGDGQHKVYRVPIDKIVNHTTGYREEKMES